MGIVAISRKHGSGGTVLAKELALRLGYECVTRTFLEQVCREKEANPLSLGLSEEPPSLVEKLEDLMSNRNFHKVALMAGVYEYALRGDVIFIGMGSHLILSGIPNVMSIHVVRLLSDRVKAIAGVKNIPYDEALELIEKMDGGKKEFIENYFDRDIDDPTQYHMTINSSLVSLEDGLEIVLGYARTYFQKELEAEARLQLGGRLLEKRAEMLLFCLDLVHDYAKISFQALGDGILVAKGVIGGEHGKERLFEALKTLKGVKEVEDHLKVGVLSHIVY